MTGTFVFHRPDLARRFADDALGLSPCSDDSGLILTAPRRTGKNTLLAVDLVPELGSRGATVVHVDLEADPSREAAEVVKEAVARAVSDGGDRGHLADHGRGLRDGVTLSAALGGVVGRTRRPVVVVVDEAQRFLTSHQGAGFTHSLKAARDALNIGAPATERANLRLGIVMVGSNRDGMSAMVRNHRQAFYCSRLRSLPLLGRNYAEAYADHVDAGDAFGMCLDRSEVAAAFEVVSHRPMLLEAAVSAHVNGRHGAAGASTLTACAQVARTTSWADLDATWAGFTDVQRAILARMVSEGESFRPMTTRR